MELKFLLFTFIVLFAAFESIESTSRSSGRGTYPRPGRFNSTSAHRPWATVPPPRYRDGNYTSRYPVVNGTRYRPICTDRWNSTSPCRPFATVPPPINHGQSWHPSHRYPVYPHYPRQRQLTDISQLDPAFLHQVNGASETPRSNSTAFNYVLYNGTEETLARPYSSHEVDSNRRVGYTTVTVVNATGAPLVAGNSSYYSG